MCIMQLLIHALFSTKNPHVIPSACVSLHHRNKLSWSPYYREINLKSKICCNLLTARVSYIFGNVRNQIPYSCYQKDTRVYIHASLLLHTLHMPCGCFLLQAIPIIAGNCPSINAWVFTDGRRICFHAMQHDRQRVPSYTLWLDFCGIAQIWYISCKML